jgi:hypothetical protein
VSHLLAKIVMACRNLLRHQYFTIGCARQTYYAANLVAQVAWLIPKTGGVAGLKLLVHKTYWWRGQMGHAASSVRLSPTDAAASHELHTQSTHASPLPLHSPKVPPPASPPPNPVLHPRYSCHILAIAVCICSTPRQPFAPPHQFICS